MIIEKSHTSQYLIEKITPTATKVSFMPDEVLSKALLHLESKGLPTNKHEDYKYCNVDALIKKEFKNTEQKFLSPENTDALRLQNSYSLFVVNGKFAPELSAGIDVPGVSVKSFSALDTSEKNALASLADVETDAFIALNTAFCGDGLMININPNVVLDKPIHVIFLQTPAAISFVNARSLVMIGQNAQATIIEEQLTQGHANVFANILSEKIIANNAKLNSHLIQNDNRNAYTLHTTQVLLNRDAHYENTTVTLGGQMVRNNHNVVLNGENAHAALNGLFTANESRLIDHHTLMDHRVPNCESNELYKGIMTDKGTGVFNGKIFVRQDAQKTNAYQSSKNILLSDDASVNAKPQLEIYANDVKCSHGTSTGKIDENALFYLNARGIGKETAKKMLLASFAEEVLNKIEIPALHEKISSHFSSQL